MTGSDIRRQFLEYFKKHDHQIVRSSSLVPVEDPTLLFTNAGMVQFKRTFLGEETRGYVRAASSQKCVRAGGKHNDLENVGYTARHHTFFEMLGNFSFGDYFKEKAIEFAWDILVTGYGLAVDKLWVSVYLNDDEAHNIWHKNVGVSEDRIVRFGDKDNFWSMGDTGPCGPCSEILIDRGEKYGCRKPDCRVGCECDRYLEIWNLVFMQFERDASGKMTPLPRPSIDTGMGLERIAAVVQNVPTNYDTDLIIPIIKKTEELSQKSLGDSAASDVAMKVIADHSRAAAFLICDGILPSNEGRGYVLRRIMRRAIRYGRNIGLVKPFLHETSQVVIETMKEAYPEFDGAESFIANVIKNEEARFSETLDNGLRLLNDTLSEIKAKGLNTVSGDIIFKLYDTYGFPPDIVRDIVRDVVRDEKLFLDMDGFNAAMESQREKSRSVATFTGITEAYKNLSVKRLIPRFVGYDKQTCESKVLLIVKDGKETSEAGAGSDMEIVTEETPFYGESGGQTGDTGSISSKNLEIAVTDTIKDPAGIIIHKGKIITGAVSKGQSVTLAVDNKRRNATALNHTATHILHSILKQILGDHVKQAGSFVSSERLRFDFTHFSQVDSETLDKIESLVNERIRENALTCAEEMDADKAFKSGATALFEEKYGDVVRVISLGSFSKELCGGTHTDRTGNIGLFKIIGESSVASGVRRIEALTGAAALNYIQQSVKILYETARIVKEKPEALSQKVEKMLSRQRFYEKELEKTKVKIASRAAEEIDNEIKLLNGIRVLVKKVSADTPAALRDIADKFRDKIKSGIVVLGSAADSKVFLIVVVTNDLAGKYHAGNIVKHVSSVVGGGGGGRPDMAQAGGSIPEKLDEALAGVYDVISGI